jgi:AcrR family transcriptional regulator
VLAAARKILLREGYTHTTTAAIAQEAGLAPNAVRWYFPHKDDTLAAVVDELLDTHLTRDHGTDLDALIEAVHALGAFRGLAPAVAERARHSPAVAACATRVHELLAEHADRLLAGLGDPLTRAAITTVLANEITNPLAAQQPEVLRHTLRRLLS